MATTPPLCRCGAGLVVFTVEDDVTRARELLCVPCAQRRWEAVTLPPAVTASGVVDCDSVWYRATVAALWARP